MKEKKFRKVVKRDYYDIMALLIIGLGMMALINIINCFLYYFNSPNKGIEATIASLGVFLIVIIIAIFFMDREVYWEEIK